MDKPTPPAAGAQQRELQEPTERSRPVPLLVAAITVLMVLLAVAYLLLSDPPHQEIEEGKRRKKYLYVYQIELKCKIGMTSEITGGTNTDSRKPDSFLHDIFSP